MDNIFIAGTSGVRQYFQSVHSWENMTGRKGDRLKWYPHNQGETGRTIAVEMFLRSDSPAIMMCDLDHDFPQDTLERLRNHDKDMASGHYLYRQTSTLRSVWSFTIDGNWPYIPYLYFDIPKGGMHRIATTGLGCVLIKREVIEAVKKYLDYWEPNSNVFDRGKVPEEALWYGVWGSDMRFFYYAQRLGFELWGDADLDVPHVASIWLKRDIHKIFNRDINKEAKRLNEDVVVSTAATKGVITLNALYARKMAIERHLAKLPNDSDETKVLSGQLAEVEILIGVIEQNRPPIGYVERWYRDPQPALPDGTPVKFPAFKSSEELQERLDNPEKDIDGNNPEQSAKARKQATRSHAIDAAKILDGKQDGADAI